MPKYKMDTDELRIAAKKLRSEGDEMRSAIDAADSTIATARDMQSPRIARDVENWDVWKTKVETALDDLVQAAQALDITAQAIDDVNNT